jgi:hypothetical protein
MSDIGVSEIDENGWVHLLVNTSYGHEPVKLTGRGLTTIDVDIINLCDAAIDDEEANEIIEWTTCIDIPACPKCIQRTLQNNIISELEQDGETSDV